MAGTSVPSVTGYTPTLSFGRDLQAAPPVVQLAVGTALKALMANSNDKQLNCRQKLFGNRPYYKFDVLPGTGWQASYEDNNGVATLRRLATSTTLDRCPF